MAADKVAISPDKTRHYYSARGLATLKRMHEQMRIKGWQYGDAKDAESLAEKILTPTDISIAVAKAKEVDEQKVLLDEKDQIIRKLTEENNKLKKKDKSESKEA